MLGSSERAQMRDMLARVRGDLEVTLVLRRGDTTLPAQQARVTRSETGRRVQGEGVQESRGSALVFGAAEMDIRTGDRFTLDGILYQVTFVRPNREFSTTAEVEVAQ